MSRTTRPHASSRRLLLCCDSRSVAVSFGACGPWVASTSTSSGANGWRCSGRTGPARPRCSTSSPATSPPPKEGADQGHRLHDAAIAVAAPARRGPDLPEDEAAERPHRRGQPVPRPDRQGQAPPVRCGGTATTRGCANKARRAANVSGSALSWIRWSVTCPTASNASSRSASRSSPTRI